MKIEHHEKWPENEAKINKIAPVLSEMVESCLSIDPCAGHSDLQTGRPMRILELGSGFGWFTALLRRAFPDSRLEGIDRKPHVFNGPEGKSESPALELLDAIHYGDLLSEDPEISWKKQLARGFDLMILGSYQQPLATHFSIAGAEGFCGCLNELVKMGRKEGFAIAVCFLSLEVETAADRNFLDFCRLREALSAGRARAAHDLNLNLPKLVESMMKEWGMVNFQQRSIRLKGNEDQSGAEMAHHRSMPQPCNLLMKQSAAWARELHSPEEWKTLEAEAERIDCSIALQGAGGDLFQLILAKASM